MNKESILLNRTWSAAQDRLSILKRLYPREFTNLKVNKSTQKNLGRPSFQKLNAEYNSICTVKLIYERETMRTVRELKLLHSFQAATHKHFYHSTWIGSACFDLFVPNVRSNVNGGRVMRGLLIEVDGDVHNLESKMRKDELKIEVAQMIGIGVTSVPNFEFSESTVKNIIEKVNMLQPLESRERRRLWRRIYLLTLAIHLSDDEFFALFSKAGTE